MKSFIARFKNDDSGASVQAIISALPAAPLAGC